jgi:Zn-dependent M28 family amino/carboxypeptidase
LAAEYIATQFERLGLEPAGDNGGFYQAFNVAVGNQVLAGRNVIGRLPGSARSAESIVVGAHYDHLGIGQPEQGDSIYNGALDNASGVAGLLALAESFAHSGLRPRRSVLFVAFDAEELGLKGSKAFLSASHPEDMVAMINFDGLNLFGRTTDTWALGLDYSSLGEQFRRAARAEGIAVRIDDENARMLDAQEFFSRSDHYSFALAGVPSLFLWSGYSAAGRATGWMQAQLEEYLFTRYHQPDDEWLSSYTPDGAVQDLRIVARLIGTLSGSTTRPSWQPASPYQRH